MLPTFEKTAEEHQLKQGPQEWSPFYAEEDSELTYNEQKEVTTIAALNRALLHWD